MGKHNAGLVVPETVGEVQVPSHICGRLLKAALARQAVIDSGVDTTPGDKARLSFQSPEMIALESCALHCTAGYRWCSLEQEKGNVTLSDS